LSSIEDIMNAASQSSRIPFSAKEETIGMVPYMQRGEAIPNKLAGMIPNTPSCLSCRDENNACSRSLPNTDTSDPTTIPSAQYGRICRTSRLK
jgi:hypothetical protein